MGRGRQKAKQTKVARKLKYFSPETDYRQLERELKGSGAADGEDGAGVDLDDVTSPAEEDDYWEPSGRAL